MEYTFRKNKIVCCVVSIVVCLVFFNISCDALNQDTAKNIQAHFSYPEATIDDDNKYRNNTFYSFCKKISEGTQFGDIDSKITKSWAKNLKQKLDLLAKKLGSSNEANIKKIDISYKKLKEFYDRYKKGYKTIKFISHDSTEHIKTLNEIKEYFDNSGSGKALYNLAEKHLFDFPQTLEVFGATVTVNDHHSQGFFRKILKEIIKTTTGTKRIESLLLLKLLSFVEGNPLEITFKEDVKNSDKAKISFRKKASDYEITCYQSGELIVDIDSMDCIDLSVFSIDNGLNNPKATRTDIEKIKTTMKKVVKGEELEETEEQLETRGYNMIACSIVHELNHAYDLILFGDIKDDDGISTGAYLKNEKLCEYFIPLLNSRLKDKILSIYRMSNKTQQNLKKLVDTWDWTINNLIDRELAREISTLDNPNDMLAMSGVVPIQTSQGKFTLVVDYQNENAIRHELEEPYVFGHYRYKFCAVEKESEAKYIKEQKEGKYDPYDISIIFEEGKYKVFEPYIFEEIINEAIINLGGIYNMRLFEYVISPDEKRLGLEIERERQALIDAREERKKKSVRELRKIERKENRTGKKDYRAREKQRYLEKNVARKEKYKVDGQSEIGE